MVALQADDAAYQVADPTETERSRVPSGHRDGWPRWWPLCRYSQPHDRAVQRLVRAAHDDAREWSVEYRP